jgi:hypothetical protein
MDRGSVRSDDHAEGPGVELLTAGRGPRVVAAAAEASNMERDKSTCHMT